MKSIEQFEQIRQEKAKKVKLFIILASSFYATFLLILIFGFVVLQSDNLSNAPLILGCFGTLFMIMGLIFLVLIIVNCVQWSNFFKNEIVKTLMENEYPNCSYLKDKGIDKELFFEPAFFHKPDIYKSNNFLKATYEDILIESADYTLQDRHQDSKGNVSYQTYAQGRFFCFSFNRTFNEVVKVCEKSGPFNFSFNTKLKKVELESVEFNKKFSTTSSSPQAAFYILTPQVQEELLRLERSFKGGIFFCFKENHLYVAINNFSSSYSSNVFRPLEGETLKTITNEIRVPKRFVDSLKLNREKFNMNINSI